MAERPIPQQTVFDSIQAEVTKETSPLLELLVNNIKSIVLGIVGLLVLFGGYTYYGSYQEEQAIKEQLAFSTLVTTTTPENRIEKIEEHLKTAPASIRLTAYFTIAQTAQDQKLYQKAYEAWQQIATLQPLLQVEATMGMSQALINQNKLPEALALLEALLPKISKEYTLHVNAQIATVAEGMKNYSRAAQACALVVSETTEAQSLLYWKQKLAALNLAAKQAQ